MSEFVENYSKRSSYVRNLIVNIFGFYGLKVCIFIYINLKLIFNIYFICYEDYLKLNKVNGIPIIHKDVIEMIHKKFSDVIAHIFPKMFSGNFY